MRGLKQGYLLAYPDVTKVAPYVGAWIETVAALNETQGALSHPTWVRGLKPGGWCASWWWWRRTLRGCVD